LSRTKGAPINQALSALLLANVGEKSDWAVAP